MSDPIAGNGGTFLGPEQRAAAWERLGGEQFDVVVFGGGVVGAGAALDAATRGLKVALVEARDFASGTSSRSSTGSGAAASSWRSAASSRWPIAAIASP